MSTYTRIKTLPLSIFNNAEYLTFMNHVIDLVKTDETDEGGGSPGELSVATAVPELGLSEEFIAAYEADLLALADAVDESRAAVETSEMSTHEKNRDSLATYITTRVSRAGSLPLEAERDAGKALYRVVKPYIGIARLPVAQETAKIRGLLMDLRKEENAPYVAILGLEAYLAELESENEAYDALSQQRVNSRAASKKESGTAIRERIDAQYDELTLLAQSFAIAQPSDKGNAFIPALNQLIAETTAAYNQRMAQGKKGEETKPEPEPDGDGSSGTPEGI